MSNLGGKKVEGGEHGWFRYEWGKGGKPVKGLDTLTNFRQRG